MTIDPPVHQPPGLFIPFIAVVAVVALVIAIAAFMRGRSGR
jgi:hypothetical protein